MEPLTAWVTIICFVIVIAVIYRRSLKKGRNYRTMNGRKKNPPLTQEEMEEIKGEDK